MTFKVKNKKEKPTMVELDGVTVYARRKKLTKGYYAGGINWNAKGTKSIKETEKFIVQLKKAIKIKKKLR